MLTLLEIAGTPLKRVGSEMHGPCPVCGGTDRFRVNLDHGDGRGRWYCRRCEPRGGDAAALIMALSGCGFREALKALGEESRSWTPPKVPARTPEAKPQPTPPAEALNRPANVRHIAETGPVAAYLNQRGIDARLFCGGDKIDVFGGTVYGRGVEVMLCRWVFPDGEPGGWYFIDPSQPKNRRKRWLKQSGGKPSDHPGGSFQITGDSEFIGTCEGVEDALSLMEMTGFALPGLFDRQQEQAARYGLSAFAGLRVWPCGGTANLARFVPPEGTERIFIFRDPGLAGGDATRTLKRRLGGIVEVIDPPRIDGRRCDWNDFLKHKKGII